MRVGYLPEDKLVGVAGKGSTKIRRVIHLLCVRLFALFVILITFLLLYDNLHILFLAGG